MLKKIELQFGEKTFGSYLALAKDCNKNVKIPLPNDLDVSAIVRIKFFSCYDVVSYATFRLERFNDGDTTHEKYTRKYYHYEGLEKITE